MMASTAAAAQSDVQVALGWLRSQQASDGGFSNGFSEGSDVGATADAVVAIASAGEDPSTWKQGGLSTVDYLAAHAGDSARHSGQHFRNIVQYPLFALHGSGPDFTGDSWHI